MEMHLGSRTGSVPLSAHVNGRVNPQDTALGACGTSKAPKLVSITLHEVKAIKNNRG